MNIGFYLAATLTLLIKLRDVNSISHQFLTCDVSDAANYVLHAVGMCEKHV
jgi:hypothetical protein